MIGEGVTIEDGVCESSLWSDICCLCIKLLSLNPPVLAFPNPAVPQVALTGCIVVGGVTIIAGQKISNAILVRCLPF
jgi:hypothetical protein